jgi:hypothetical protein
MPSDMDRLPPSEVAAFRLNRSYVKQSTLQTRLKSQVELSTTVWTRESKRALVVTIRDRSVCHYLRVGPTVTTSRLHLRNIAGCVPARRWKANYESTARAATDRLQWRIRSAPCRKPRRAEWLLCDAGAQLLHRIDRRRRYVFDPTRNREATVNCDMSQSLQIGLSESRICCGCEPRRRYIQSGGDIHGVTASTRASFGSLMWDQGPLGVLRHRPHTD